MRIGLDIDDTTVKTYETLIKYADIYDKEYLRGTGIVNDISMSPNGFLQEIYDWSYEEVVAFLNINYCKILKECIPLDNAVEIINNLLEEGHEIYYITARSNSFSKYKVETITEEHFKKHNIPYQKIIYNSKSKLQACIDNKIDIFVDNSYQVCKELTDNGIKCFLMTCLSNKKINNKNIERVKDWKDLDNKLNKYLKNENQVIK